MPVSFDGHLRRWEGTFGRCGRAFNRADRTATRPKPLVLPVQTRARMDRPGQMIRLRKDKTRWRDHAIGFAWRMV
jgi:hypothetical protein